MLKFIPILGELPLRPQDNLPNTGGLIQKGSITDVLLIVGVGLAMAFVLFLIVYLSRGRRARGKAMVRSSRVLYDESARSSGSSKGKVRKRRKSHPDNLPRNPTLGETGGLPPLRPENPSDP
ncbi:MAG: hypothetical protein JWM16_1060 [Verrucomicrobiales bacterium]|nr:hypothetical protein [Verrucomicrobiales bacterium]